LEGTHCFCLEEKPLSCQEFLDLRNVVENSLIEVFFVLEKALIFQKQYVFLYDFVLTDNGKLCLLIIFAFLETLIVNLPAVVFMVIIRLIITQIQQLILFVVVTPVLLALQKFGRLDGQHLPLGIHRQ
jgi:hypothetical protein